MDRSNNKSQRTKSVDRSFALVELSGHSPVVCEWVAGLSIDQPSGESFGLAWDPTTKSTQVNQSIQPIGESVGLTWDPTTK